MMTGASKTLLIKENEELWISRFPPNSTAIKELNSFLFSNTYLSEASTFNAVILFILTLESNSDV